MEKTWILGLDKHPFHLKGKENFGKKHSEFNPCRIFLGTVLDVDAKLKCQAFVGPLPPWFHRKGSQHFAGNAGNMRKKTSGNAKNQDGGFLK